MCLPWLAFHWDEPRPAPRVSYLALVAFWLSFRAPTLPLVAQLAPGSPSATALHSFPSLVQWYEVDRRAGG